MKEPAFYFGKPDSIVGIENTHNLIKLINKLGHDEEDAALVVPHG